VHSGCNSKHAVSTARACRDLKRLPGRAPRLFPRFTPGDIAFVEASGHEGPRQPLCRWKQCGIESERLLECTLCFQKRTGTEIVDRSPASATPPPSAPLLILGRRREDALRSPSQAT
jgi:hypothetical protein